MTSILLETYSISASLTALWYAKKRMKLESTQNVKQSRVLPIPAPALFGFSNKRSDHKASPTPSHLLNQKLERYARALSNFCSLSVLLTATVLLFIWFVRPDLKEFSAITMKANAALALFFSSLSLWLLNHASRAESQFFSRKKNWGRVFAGMVLLIGALTAIEYAFGIRLGIDELLVTDFPNAESRLFPGRMSPIAAACFSLLGLSLLSLDTKLKNRYWHLPSLFLFSVLLFSLLAVIGYLYGVTELYQFGPYIRTALLTAVCVHLLSIGILVARPHRGPIRFLFSSTSSGLLARCILPPVLILPVILGWLRIQAQRLGHVDLALGTALLVVALILVFTLIVGWCIKALELTDSQRVTSLTRERLSQQALSLSERKFSIVFENAPFAVALIKMPSTVIADANPAFVKLFGYSKAELIGKTSVELGMHQDLEAQKRIAEEFERSGTVRNLESEVRSQSGRSLTVANNLDLIELDGQKYVLVTLEDITERRKAEGALQAEQHRLKAVLINSPSALSMKGLDGRYSFANPNFDRLLGISSESLLRKTDFELFPDEIAQALRSNDQKVIETGQRLTFEETIPTQDGRLRTFMSHKFPILDPHGNPESVCSISLDITEKKRAEAALQESESRFRNLANAMPQLAWMANPDGFITWYNKGWYDYTGTTPEKMEGWGWQSVHDPVELPKVLARWNASIATGEPFEMPFPIKGSDSKFRWFLTRGVPVKDEAGIILRWLGTNTNIDDLKNAEQEVANVLESMGDAFISLDKDFRVLRVNKHQERISGLSRDQTIGRIHWDIWPKEIIPNLWTAYHRVIHEHVPIHIEEFNSHLKVWLAVDAYPTPEGGIAVFFRDITEQKNILNKLQDSTFQFETMANSLPQLAWMADETGWIFWYNQRWYDYTGTNFQEMEGWGWTKVHHPDHADRIVKSFGHSVKRGEPWEDLFPLRSKSDEWRWFLSRAEPVRDASGKIIRWFGSNTDVTEKKRIEQALTDAVRARDEFLSIASHELKTPLTSMKLQTQSMKRNAERGDPNVYSPERVSKLVEQTDRQVDRISRLVDDMLDVSRIQTGNLTMRKEPLEFCELVMECAERLKPQLVNASVQLEFDARAPIVGVWDRIRMEQVITNLLTNAMKYGKGKPVKLRINEENDRILFSVQDFGVGISKDSFERIFNRFERAISANEVSGLGLGLFITRQIVEAHGGKIWVESELGRGSTFFVHLPLEQMSTMTGRTANYGA